MLVISAEETNRMEKWTKEYGESGKFLFLHNMVTFG